jgi:CHAT domain-containing protein
MKKIISAVFLLYTGTCFSQQVDSLLAARYCSMADSLRKAGQSDSALVYYQRATGSLAWGRKLANCYNNISEIHWKSRRLAQSLEAAEKALRISREKPEKETAEEAFAYFNIATVYYYDGEYVLSLDYFRKALPIQRKIMGDHHYTVAQGYNAIGYLYWKLGNLEESLAYFQKALALTKQMYGEHHKSNADILTNIGIIYRNLGKPDVALEYHFKTLAIVKELYKKTDIHHAICYHNIASVYGDKKEYEKALDYVLKGCSIAYELMGDRDPDIALGYDNVARFYQALGDSAKAFEYLQRSFAIRTKVYQGGKHPSLGKSYRDLGEWYFEKKDYRHALAHFQKSLVASVNAFNDLSQFKNPLMRDCQHKTDVLSSLEKKAKTLKTLYEKEKNSNDLFASFQTYHVIDSLIDEARREKSTEGDKLALANIKALLYEGAIEVCMSMYDDTNDMQYLAEAFYFSEKSRASVLTEALAHTAAQGMGLVPIELLALERHIKKEKSGLLSRLELEKSRTPHHMRTVEQYETRLFDLNQRLDSLIESMEINYPGYFQLKYANKSTDVNTIQRKISEHAALLQFFEGKERIRVFMITQDRFQVFSVANDSTYRQLTREFYASIKPDGAHDINKEQTYHNFTSASYKLFTLLLKNPIKAIRANDEIRNLMIIPDGQLSYLPFDVLLTKEPSSVLGNYAALDYLIKEYSTAYGYSATLLFENTYTPKRFPVDMCMSFAPSYDSKSDQSALAKFREAFTELHWNRKEVEAISTIVRGRYYIGRDATESRFKSEASQYNVIHLAMHAFANDEEPMKSKLVFNHQNDTVDDGYLHAFELYNLQLNASMVVLSACNTGYGKLSRGEGIMSMARAFAYSGVPSVVMSHWKVDDEATSKLMEYFYKYLADGLTKDEALRKAKLDYLFSAHPSTTHPFYWAAFVVTGDTKAVIDKNYYAVIAIGVISVVVLLSAFWIKRKGDSTQAKHL